MLAQGKKSEDPECPQDYVTIPFDGVAGSYHLKMEQQLVESLDNGSYRIPELRRRNRELAMKVSGVLACWKHPNGPLITLELLQWAEKFVYTLSERFEAEAASRIFGCEQNWIADAIIAYLKKTGKAVGIGLLKNRVRRLQKLSPVQQDSLLKALVSQGLLVATQTGHAVVYSTPG